MWRKILHNYIYPYTDAVSHACTYIPIGLVQYSTVYYWMYSLFHWNGHQHSFRLHSYQFGAYIFIYIYTKHVICKCNAWMDVYEWTYICICLYIHLSASTYAYKIYLFLYYLCLYTHTFLSLYMFQYS